MRTSKDQASLTDLSVLNLHNKYKIRIIETEIFTLQVSAALWKTWFTLDLGAKTGPTSIHDDGLLRIHRKLVFYIQSRAVYI